MNISLTLAGALVGSAVAGTIVFAHPGPVDMRGGHIDARTGGYHLHSSAMGQNLRPGAYVAGRGTGFRVGGRIYYRYGTQVIYPQRNSLGGYERAELMRLRQQVNQMQRENEYAAAKRQAAESRRKIEAERTRARARARQDAALATPKHVDQPKFVCFFRSGRRRAVVDYVDEGRSYQVFYPNGGIARYPKSMIKGFIPLQHD